MRAAFGIACVLSGLFMSLGADAKPVGAAGVEFMSLGSPKMRLGAATAMPSGYYDMCSRQPSLCKRYVARGMATTEGGAVRLTSSLFEQLRSVNSKFNTRIKPVRGLSKDWTTGRKAGDCKDYAINKQQALIRSGWPSSAILLANVTTFWGDQHMVVVARTDRGDWVLDNLSASPVSWGSTSYSWDRVQSPTGDAVWRSAN